MEDLNVPGRCLYTMRIASGLVGPSHSPKPDATKFVSWDTIKKKIDQYEYDGMFKKIDSTLFLEKSSKDTIGLIFYYDYLFANKLLNNFKKFQILDHIHVKYSYIEQTPTNSIIHYTLENNLGILFRN